MTDEQIIEAVQASKDAAPVQIAKSKGGITVQGMDDVSVRFCQMLQPDPGGRDRWICDAADAA